MNNKFFLVSILFVTLSFSQNKQIRAYNLSDGLPQSQVHDILQDDYGYLWLGTQGGGIARFDGDEFNVWSEKNGLISNYIQTLLYKNDSLLIGTNYGLSVKVKNNFSNYASPQINAIKQVSNRYLLATNSGCYQFNGKDLSKLKFNKKIDRSKINDILLIGDWYYIASNYGLWKVKKDLSKIIKLSDYDFKSMLKFNDLIFAASYNKGVFAYDSKDRFQIISYVKRINALSILKNELWIATENTGVTIKNATNYSLIQKINKESGLPILNIKNIIKDKQLNIWFASSGGFFKLYDNNFQYFDKNSGLKGSSIYAIHKVQDEIYFSNSESGLMKIDSAGLQPVLSDKGFLNVKVRSIAHDTKGNLFTGTDGKGILVMHNSKRDSIATHLDDNNLIVHDTVQINFQFLDTLNKNNRFPYNWIKKIHIKNNQVWVASYANGLARFVYNTEEREVTNLKTFSFKQGLKELSITDITTDKNNTLWFATKNGHLGTIKRNKVTALGLVLGINTSIRTLLFHNDHLFIGTSDKGIWWSNLSKPINFTKLKGEKELYSNNIYQLIFDTNNQLWAGSESGVDKITLDENNTIIDLHHFGRNDGFLGIETCLNSVIKDDFDNLWFGTINGLTKHQPTAAKLIQKKPQLFFEDIEVMNEKVDTIQLQQFVKNNRLLKLNSNQNLLAFYFKTVDVNHPKELQYRWKLNNYKWSNWSKDTKVNIASDYGKHSLKAQSRNLNWIESDVISFQFEREMPLFKKVGFIWSLATVLTLFLLSLIYLYFRRVKKKNRFERERLQLENNLLTLEQKALRLQMNPHFIFNVLNGIKAMSISDVKSTHKTINKFATLLRAILTNSRKDSITLAEEISTLKNYIEVEQLMNEKTFTYNLEIKSDIDSEEILISPMLIQPFVENAIRHGIMAVKRKGVLSIIFETSANFLFCTITDNGIGINKSKENKPKSNHQSMALEVTKERIEHLAGKNTLIIKEVLDKNNKLAGTKVRFKIPLITDY